MATILLLSGPNLNLLGDREPDVYGTTTLDELVEQARVDAASHGHEVEHLQSNSEGTLIDAIHGARGRCAAIVINPGAYGHTSYALRDAIAGIRIPTVEVHLSDVEAREPFRRISTIAEVCIAKISGRGPKSYFDALDLLLERASGA